MSALTSMMLADHAFLNLTTDLRNFGNKLNDKHQLAVRRIEDVISQMAFGEIEGRFAFDLPTGCGKTQAVIAWCQAVHELQTGHSAVIAASKVEELCDVKRQLIDKGVPEQSIGLIHSKLFDRDRAEEWLRTRETAALKPAERGQRGKEYASLPCSLDNDNRPFLLVTHSRVQSKRTNIGLLNTFDGRRRNLVLWDESLLVSESRGIAKKDISSGLAWLREWVADDPSKHIVVAYFTECLDRLNNELAGQRESQRRPRAIRLPPLSDLEIVGYAKMLGTRVETRPLHTLLKFSQADIRVIPISQGGGAAFVSYDITVPRELTNIVVLDASYAIRELERLDRTIKHAPDFDGKVKRYDQVTINHMRHGSGRATMERAFCEDRKVSREICEVVSAIDPSEGVIIFTFKHDEERRSVNMREELEGDLKRFAGIDTTTPLGDGKPRFRFLTWGQETACNDFKYCSNVIFAGVIHRSEIDLSGSIVAQRDDLLSVVPGSLIADVRRSESAHSLYQAISRGTCRDTIDGQAKPMQVWLIHYDYQLRSLIDRVMPGVQWQAWTPKFLDPTDTKVEEITLKIAAHLRQLDDSVDAISTRALKRALDLTEVSHSTFNRAIQSIIEGDVGWALSRRSLVREVCGFRAATT